MFGDLPLVSDPASLATHAPFDVVLDGVGGPMLGAALTRLAKHGPCVRKHQHGGSHRTPVFRTPVIAEKKIGVKYLALTCKKCKTFNS